MSASIPPVSADPPCMPPRQAMRRLRVTVGLPVPVDPHRLADWLRGAFELEVPAIDEVGSAANVAAGAGTRGTAAGNSGTGNSDALYSDALVTAEMNTAAADSVAEHATRSAAAASTARAALLCCLSVAGALLRAARFPAFDEGDLIEIAPAPEGPPKWRASVTLPDVEGMPVRCYELALEDAIALTKWMARHPRTPQHTAALHASLDKRIHGLQRLVPAGKSTMPVLQAAWSRGIPFIHLGAGSYQLGWGSRGVPMDRSTTMHDSALGARLAQSKRWSAALAAAAGLPAPVHRVVRRLEDALAAAQALGWPVVVKPADLDRGEGVTVGIANRDALAAAFEHAHARSRAKQVIVEREVPGVCHRLFIARDRLLYAVKRLPKSVLGDGRHTVAQLVEAANHRERARPPWLRTEPWPDDDEARAAMARAGFDPGSVPAPGVPVPLRTIESTESGGFDEDVTERIHPDNLDVALRAARLFGLSVAGIDIITPDIGRPWHENGAIVNEVNFAPLLGGGEISRRHVPEFLARFVDGDGRISLEAVIGDDAGLTRARALQRVHLASGRRCFVSSGALTLTDTGAVLTLPFEGLGYRCRALLLDRRVDALVLVADSDAELTEASLVQWCARVLHAPGDGASC